jgi:hypothetical protein
MAACVFGVCVCVCVWCGNLMRATLVLYLCKLDLVTRTSRIRSKVDHAPLSVSLRSRACKRIPEAEARTPSPRFPRQGQTGTTGPK